MDLLTNLLAISCFLAFFLLYKRWKPNRKAKDAPEAAAGWPVIGHLLQLNSHSALARTLGAMADKYGPVFKIRIGMSQYLVGSNWEAVKECLTTNDRVFASRPLSNTGVYLGYNYASFGIAPYGPYWREIRKKVMVEVLSSRRLELLRHVRTSEIEISILELFSRAELNPSRAPVKVAMGEWFEQLTLNIIVRTIAWKRYSDTEAAAKFGAQHFSTIMKESMKLSGKYGLSDIIPLPFLRCLDFWHIRSMKRVAKEAGIITQNWIDEHKEKRANSNGGKDGGDDEHEDFIDVMLPAIKDDSVFGHSRETVIKATVQTLIVAGSDTTSIHLTWILSLLLNNEDAMKKAQQEIDKNVGKQRWVEESDVKNLVYLHAIVKEALRLYPPGPLSVPHLAMEDAVTTGPEGPVCFSTCGSSTVTRGSGRSRTSFCLKDS